MNGKENIVLTGKKTNSFSNKTIVKNNLNNIQTELNKTENDKKVKIINHIILIYIRKIFTIYW